MFKEILQITPKMDSGGLMKMERSLNTRFQKISKGFGKGLMSVLKSGSVLGIATTIIDKLLNPLKEVQESIDRTLGMADDVATNAEQFNASPGELLKLQKLAQAKGLDAGGLDTLILKFQGAVAEALADPSKKTAVRNFTDDDNMVQGFFKFIQALNKMDRNDQVLVQQEVFGEKQTLKMAEFLRADFAELTKLIGAKDAAAYTPDVEKMAALNDLAAALTAKRELRDVETKASIITPGMIKSRAHADDVELQKENRRLAQYQNLQAITDTSNKILELVEQGVAMLGKFMAFLTPTINRLVDTIEKFSKSALFRLGGISIFGTKGK